MVDNRPTEQDWEAWITEQHAALDDLLATELGITPTYGVGEAAPLDQNCEHRRINISRCADYGGFVSCQALCRGCPDRHRHR
jgi:hypothetical protein